VSTFKKYSFKNKQKRNFLYVKQLRENPTKAESIVLDFFNSNFKSLGLKKPPIFQKGFLKPYHRIVDFYIPKRKIIIEIDGGYHSMTQAKDIKKDSDWFLRGFKTLRVSNTQVENGMYQGLIMEFLKVY
jgi:very-short-patch-repair endonuclease